MKKLLKKMIDVNVNDEARNRWLAATLATIPQGLRILDAGAGELRNKSLCIHLIYVSQDFCQYDGRGGCSGFANGNVEY